MLATLHDQVFSGECWILERKLDGVRALCSGESGSARMWSRNQKPLDDTYPKVVEAHAPTDFAADGEIVAFEGAQTSFARLQPRINLTDRSRTRATGIMVYYHLFDLLNCDGEDLRARPQRERKELLSDTNRNGYAQTFVAPTRCVPGRVRQRRLRWTGRNWARLDRATTASATCRSGWPEDRIPGQDMHRHAGPVREARERLDKRG